MKRLSSRRLSAKQSYEPPPATRIKRDTREGTASDYYQRFSRIIKQAAKQGIRLLPVVAYYRVSSPKQARNGNLEHQLAHIRKQINRIAIKCGVTIRVVGEFPEVENAWKLWASGRPELVKAAKCTRQHKAILVALNTSRLVRNSHHARGVMPTVHDFERLMALVGSVKLATILHPDVHEDRSADTYRGFPECRKPGDKKRRRWKYKLPIIRLVKQGYSNRKIAKLLDLPEKTVRDWKKRYSKFWGASFSSKDG